MVPSALRRALRNQRRAHGADHYYGEGKGPPDGSPKDVDQEFVASFMIFDELMAKFEFQTHGMNRTFKRDPNDDMGRFYAINGYVFGNLPALTVKSGSRVRWYLMGMGGEQDIAYSTLARQDCAISEPACRRHRVASRQYCDGGHAG